MFVNRDELFSESYRKYLVGELRRAFGYEGCPIVLVPRPRPKTVEPVRKFKGSSRPDHGRKSRKMIPRKKPRPAYARMAFTGSPATSVKR